MGKKASFKAYFVANGRADFCGGVGGTRDPDRDDLWSFITNGLRKQVQPRFSTESLDNVQKLAKKWEAKERAENFESIPERWRNHRQMWNVKDAIKAIEEEEAKMGEGQRSRTERMEDGEDERRAEIGDGRKTDNNNNKTVTAVKSGQQRSTAAAEAAVLEEDYTCCECLKTESEHKQEEEANKWVECDLCTDWALLECTSGSQGFWACSQCKTANKDAHDNVHHWTDIQEQLKGIKEAVTERAQRRVR